MHHGEYPIYEMYIYIYIWLVDHDGLCISGWLKKADAGWCYASTPLENMRVSWDYDVPKYMDK